MEGVVTEIRLNRDREWWSGAMVNVRMEPLEMQIEQLNVNTVNAYQVCEMNCLQ